LPSSLNSDCIENLEHPLELRNGGADHFSYDSSSSDTSFDSTLESHNRKFVESPEFDCPSNETDFFAAVIYAKYAYKISDQALRVCLNIHKVKLI